MLQLLKPYKKSYSSDKALWWYTRQSCLYPLLNRALRMQDIDGIFAFRFFIRDIYNQLCYHRCATAVRVYRGQQISEVELKVFEKCVGQLVSFKPFYSTSRNREVAEKFAHSGGGNGTSLCSVLFEIEADPRRTTTKPFADISVFSDFKDEAEVLFMCGSIFRILNVSRGQNGLHIVRLQLCSDDDHELKKLFEYMNKQNVSWDGILAFGNLLLQMGKLDDAEKYYRIGLTQLGFNHINIVYYYHGLGIVHKEKGDYAASFECLQKSLELYKNMENHSSVAIVYNNIATLHFNKSDYKQALDSYNMALEIYRTQNNVDHQDIAMCYNNVGAVYYEQKKYLEALEYYQKALTILEKILPVDHPQLGGYYNNIGDVHLNLGHDVYAFEYYRLALSIKEKTLPAKHPSTATTHQSIGLAHEYSGDLKQALKHFEIAAAIYSDCLPEKHVNVVEIKKHILRVTTAIGEKKSP
ncbi:unnamed protein product [Rotaria socialis]|uniref:NAD(P)(+)--arginine ADP-ribosyltransferase n=2 Tax=Rotaria socialis TaxID=392032 RepID=A0A817T2I7_9BILA|nr:unnamed protein product [Rotaria socialis]